MVAAAATQWRELFAAGEGLSEEQAKQLERRIEAYPAKIELRVMRCGYESKRVPWLVDGKPRGASRHRLWLIEHAPWIEMGEGPSPFHVLATADERPRVQRLWREAVRRHPDELEVFRNALECARFDWSFLDELYDVANPLGRGRVDWLRLFAAHLATMTAYGPTPSSVYGYSGQRAAAALSCFLEAFALEGERADLEAVWSMRECAYVAGERAVLEVLRHAHVAAKAADRARKNGAEGDAREHARRARELVLEARETRAGLGTQQQEPVRDV
jgi:hypothetical protein